MKKITAIALLAVFAAMFFQSCVKDSCERVSTWVERTPVYKTQAEIDAVSVSSEAPRALKNPGKIYFYNNFIFINEINEGIHVIDNQNPEAPAKVAFLNIEGNIDIAIKDNRLFADSYTDLFVVDITDINTMAVVSRQQAFFPPIWEDNNGRKLVYYNRIVRTETLTCEARDAIIRSGGIFLNEDFAATPNSSGGGGQGNGVAGSMARFSVVGDYLYTVGQSDMNIIGVSNPDEPTLINTVNLGWGMETIFPHENKLFIGGTSGMQIWDNSNPANPSFLSEFTHARACDPVFVKDNYAYVTLRDGSFCAGFENQLDLIDISDITNPQLEKTFPMDNPHGLSIDGNTLFLCEGESGLKVFDIEDPKKLGNRKIDHIKNHFAYDVIALPNNANVLLMIGEDGFYQYDYSNPKKLKELSRIPVE